MTVLELIKSALRLTGALAAGEEPAADEAQDALAALRDMLASWSAERLSVYAIERSAYTLTAGKGSYSIGASDAAPADIEAARPVRIENAGLVVDGLEQPMDVVEADIWARVRDKTGEGAPRQLYYQPLTPLGVLWLHPVPDRAYGLALYTWQELTAPQELTDDWHLPPGYARAIRYNLAVELAAEYGRVIDGPLAALAAQAKAVLQSFNAPAPVMECDPALLGGYAWGNWRSC